MEARHSTSLTRSLAIQSRVIGALLMREIITRYGRHNIGFMWLFAEPMLFTLAIVGLWTASRATHGSNIPIVAFAVTGYSSILLWRNSALRCTKAILPNLSLLVHRNITVLDVFVARILLEVAGGIMSFIILSTAFIALGWMAMPVDVFKIVQALLLLSWFALSLSLIIGAITELSEVLDRFWHPTVYILFPLSGAVFMVDWLPKDLQTYVLWLPMVHGVEMLRSGYFGPGVVTHYSVSYQMLMNFVLLLIGLFLVDKAGRQVIPE